MKPVIDLSMILDFVKSDMTIMFGGFGGCGTPDNVIDLISLSDIDNLTVITNDVGIKGQGGIFKLLENTNQIKKLVCSHIGTVPIASELYLSNKISVIN